MCQVARRSECGLWHQGRGLHEVTSNFGFTKYNKSKIYYHPNNCTGSFSSSLSSKRAKGGEGVDT